MKKKIMHSIIKLLYKHYKFCKFMWYVKDEHTILSKLTGIFIQKAAGTVCHVVGNRQNCYQLFLTHFGRKNIRFERRMNTWHDTTALHPVHVWPFAAKLRQVIMFTNLLCVTWFKQIQRGVQQRMKRCVRHKYTTVKRKTHSRMR